VILNAIYDLEKYGVKLKSMTEPFDTGDASGRFLLTILATSLTLNEAIFSKKCGLAQIDPLEKEYGSVVLSLMDISKMMRNI
jgi:hypothetical protein